MKEYREIIAMGFINEADLENFLFTIENDEKINARAYYNLKHEALERFYEI